MIEALAVVNPETQITIQEVKQYLCPQATDKELYMFVQLCKSQSLNPWIREVYLIKYGTGPATIVVGKDVFTKRAQANSKFKGFTAGVILERNGQIIEAEGSFKLPNDNLVGGWAKVYLDGYEVPVSAHVSMEEYGRDQASWKKMPATMIRKVALVQALREAFPEELGGLYDSAEMGTELPVEKPTIKPPQRLSEIKETVVEAIVEDAPQSSNLPQEVERFFRVNEDLTELYGPEAYKKYLCNSKGESPELDRIKTFSTEKQLAWLNKATSLMQEFIDTEGAK